MTPTIPQSVTLSTIPGGVQASNSIMGMSPLAFGIVAGTGALLIIGFTSKNSTMLIIGGLATAGIIYFLTPTLINIQTTGAVLRTMKV